MSGANEKIENNPEFTGDLLHGLPVGPGTGSAERLLPALRQGYFRLDEKGPRILLAMAGQYASQLRFYNKNNKENGDWTGLFDNDESAVMADILSFTPAAPEERFLRVLDLDIEQAVRAILVLADRLESWLEKLSVLESDRAEMLANYIGGTAGPKLARELDNLALFLTGHRLRRGVSAPLVTIKGFAGLRGAGARRADAAGSGFVYPAGQAGVRAFLLTAYYSFQHAISHLQAMIPPLWRQSLHSGRHDPAVGLFIAFLQLYEKVVNRANTFVERHLDFYYQDVLRAKARGPQPDAVHLVCRAGAGAGAEAFIGKGSRFVASAGEAGGERLYLADNDLHVTDARVDSLLSLCFESNKLVSPSRELGCFTRCRTNNLAAAVEPPPGAAPSGLPIFGEDEKMASRYGAREAQLGLAVAAVELLLGQGRRRVSVTIGYEGRAGDEAAEEKLLAELEAVTGGEEEFFSLFGQIMSRYLLLPGTRIAATTRRRILQAARALNIARSSRLVIHELLKQGGDSCLFYKLLGNVFHIDLTGESGWLAVDRYVVSPVVEPGPGGGAALRVTFNLGSDAEPVTGYSRETHGPGYDTELPLLRLRINHRAEFFPYSLFKNLFLRKIVLETSTHGLREFQAHNQHGRLDPTMPFQPFGPLPKQYSYLIIGSYEMARKRLTGVEFQVDWADLPDDWGGFGEYYKGYEGVFTNESFKVDFSLLSDGRWLPQTRKKRRVARLFSWRQADGRLLERNRLIIGELKRFQPLSAKVDPERYALGPKIGNGFVKWELAGSRRAFGHAQYPELLSKVLTANARRKKPLPLPGAPYTPVINSLGVNYTARCEIDPAKDLVGGGEEKIFHIHPFGIETIYPRASKKRHGLVPVHDHAGNLFIGLSGRRVSGILPLYFQLNEDSGRIAMGRGPEIDWFYSTEGGWRRFEASQIVADTTDNFLNSGIVTFDIPSAMSCDNVVMGRGLYWLRAATNFDPHVFSSLRGVYAHGLRATRAEPLAPAAGAGAAHLAAWSVTGAFSTIAGLSEVLQPQESFHGGPAEDRGGLIIRMSERLRHKDRAVTAWDYERLVLERFSGIGRVKCFPHMQSQPRPAGCPGRVLIVVVPEVSAKESAADSQLRVNASLAAEIRDFLRQKSSPFIEFEVRNPEYEQIQVRCAVKFESRLGGGIFLNKLNKAIVDYISPWRDSGYRARFGWSLRLDDIRSYLTGLDYVEYITDFSVLHITANHKREFYRADSVRGPAGPDDGGTIRPRYPWSLPLPLKRHFIKPLDAAGDITPHLTGINELEIGTTFVINE